jgi:hypothetical protein
LRKKLVKDMKDKMEVKKDKEIKEDLKNMKIFHVHRLENSI